MSDNLNKALKTNSRCNQEKQNSELRAEHRMCIRFCKENMVDLVGPLTTNK